MNIVKILIVLSFYLSSTLLADEQLTVVDHTGTFPKFWKELTEKKKDVEKRMEKGWGLLLFHQVVHNEFRDYYDHRLAKAERQQSKSQEPEATIMSHYERFPKIRERYLEVAKLLPKYLQDSLVSFKKAFPDFTAPFQAHLIHSLGEMDGGTRTLNGKFYFLFGVDRIAEEHKHLDFKSKQPFLHHEIFHVYHRQFFTDESSLVPGLWSEGLAVLTAAELNPKATLAQLSMDNPKDLVQKCEKVRAKLIADIKERVERPGPEDYEMYFFSSSEHPWIPKRAGYFVGYRIATLARKQKSLAELAKLNVEEVKALILSLIDKI